MWRNATWGGAHSSNAISQMPLLSTELLSCIPIASGAGFFFWCGFKCPFCTQHEQRPVPVQWPNLQKGFSGSVLSISSCVPQWAGLGKVSTTTRGLMLRGSLLHGADTLAGLAKLVRSAETWPLCFFSRVSQFSIKQTNSIFPDKVEISAVFWIWCGATLHLVLIRDLMQCLVTSAFRKGLLLFQSHLFRGLIWFISCYFYFYWIFFLLLFGEHWNDIRRSSFSLDCPDTDWPVSFWSRGTSCLLCTV